MLSTAITSHNMNLFVHQHSEAEVKGKSVESCTHFKAHYDILI